MESGRARPMPPDERRAALIEATVPLLGRCGTRVTTRQIALAAGVAEGTIFRVFEDKDELIRNAIAAGLDPGPALDELDQIDPAAPLRDRLVAIVGVLQRRLLASFNLIITLGATDPDDVVRQRTAEEGATVIQDRIGRLLEPDRDRFRRPVTDVVRLLRLLTIAGSHPMIISGEPLSAEDVADVVLYGVYRRSAGGASQHGTSADGTMLHSIAGGGSAGNDTSADAAGREVGRPKKSC